MPSIDNIVRMVLMGLTEHHGAVRAGDFAGMIQKLIAALRELEDASTDSDAEVDRHELILHELSYNSPATIEIEATDGDAPEQVVSRFYEGVSAIEGRGEVPHYFTLSLAEKIRELIDPDRKKFERVTIGTEKQDSVALTGRSAGVLDEFIRSRSRVDRTALGTLKGRLERATVHSKRECTIYPYIGPTSVKCSFSRDMIDHVAAAFSRKVRARGLLFYKDQAPFPYKMELHEIEVLKEDADLPTMEDARNAVRKGPGSVEYGQWEEWEPYE